MKMTPNEALSYVIEAYNLKPQKLAEDSGVHKSMISKFINGRGDIHSGNLQKIVKALPPQARTHFGMLFSFDIAIRNDLKVVEKSN